MFGVPHLARVIEKGDRALPGPKRGFKGEGGKGECRPVGGAKSTGKLKHSHKKQ